MNIFLIRSLSRNGKGFKSYGIMRYFTTFSPEHLIAIAIIFLTTTACVVIARNQKLMHLVKPVSWTLAIVAVGHELLWVSGVIALGLWHYSWGIPLQLCDLAIFAVALTLIKHYQWVWELAYFWGLGGSLQAVLTPDLDVTFPDYVFIKFFLSHGCIVIGVIFLAVGLRRTIMFRSVVSVFVITNVYGLFVLFFNRLAGTNYMYLLEKPTQPSLLDYAGDGFIYYLGLEVLLILSLTFYYLPYFIMGLKKKITRNN